MSKELASDGGLATALNLSSLVSLNEWLTGAMARQQVQATIKGAGLEAVVGRVLHLAALSEGDRLFAGAMLGRLMAVARGREALIASSARLLLTADPGSLDILSDGDEKNYAAIAVSALDGSWVSNFCFREATKLDTAENARRELLRTALKRCDSVEEWVLKIVVHMRDISIDGAEQSLRRVRRVFAVALDVLKDHDGPLGPDPGLAVASAFGSLVRDAARAADIEVINATLDALVAMIVRMIEIRFSYALKSDTYRLLIDLRRGLQVGQWSRFVESSLTLNRLRTDLLEAALVLARQNRTDREILKAMEASWPTLAQASTAMKTHFSGAQDLDVDTASYWLKVGRVAESSRSVEHRLGNTEDQQIGELLIQLQVNRESMGKLDSAVVPILKTFDPCQAATVQRAAQGYESVAQVAERIARMRRLTKTELVGSQIEYNPLEHEMEGGHRSGVRMVRVVRDGILKDFGGRRKILVKPRVEPIE